MYNKESSTLNLPLQVATPASRGEAAFPHVVTIHKQWSEFLWNSPQKIFKFVVLLFCLH